MKVIKNDIVEITESELFQLYLERGYDNIMSFIDYKKEFIFNGCEVKE